MAMFAWLVALMVVGVVKAADPDPINDICVADLTSTLSFNGLPCKSYAKVTSEDFTFRGLELPGNVSGKLGAAVSPAFAGVNYPGLNTLGVAVARVDVAPGHVVPLHTHPRGTEVFYILAGTWMAGFVDTNDKLFISKLKPGDLFVFPRGLVHFSFNTGKKLATAIAFFNAQNPGTQLMPFALFASGIDPAVLAKNFGIDSQTEAKIEKGVLNLLT